MGGQANFLSSLQYHDEYSAGIAIENLGRLVSAWEQAGDAIEALACSEEVKGLLKAIVEETRKVKTS